MVSLILCDVNGLERVNEEYGLDRGDALLVRLAGVMSAAAALLPGSLAGRLSDHGFCVLIEGYGADDAIRVAEELCNLALTVRGGEGVACGVASTGDRIGDVITRDRLLRLADAALHRAKRSRSLHPVVAGRGQPPNMEGFAAPTGAGLGPAVESLLNQAFAALDEARRDAAASGIPVADRIAVVLEVVARGLDAASWYIYSKPSASEPLSAVRYSVYRTTAEPGSTDQPVEPEYFTGIEDVLLSGGKYIELPNSGFDGDHGNGYAWDIAPGAAKLAAAGYTGALIIGSIAPDRSQWMVTVLLDPSSKRSTAALLLLRAVLGAAVG